MFIKTKFDLSSNGAKKSELENNSFMLLINCFNELFRFQLTEFKAISHNIFSPKALSFEHIKAQLPKLKAILHNKFSPKTLALALVLISSVVITPTALAYKQGYFPGVGSYSDWVKAGEYYNQANHTNGIAEKAELYKKAISIYPYEASFWVNYASFATNDEQEKINCYLKAAQLNPDDPLGYQDAGVEYQKLGQYQKAIECYEKALTIKPTVSSYYVSIFNCYLNLKKFNEAAICSLKGYNVTNDTDLLYNVGYSYDKGGNYKLALKYYQDYLKLNPTDKDTINSIKKLQNK